MNKSQKISIILIVIILLYFGISTYFAWKDGYFLPKPQIYNPCTAILLNITAVP